MSKTFYLFTILISTSILYTVVNAESHITEPEKGIYCIKVRQLFTRNIVPAGCYKGKNLDKQATYKYQL